MGIKEFERELYRQLKHDGHSEASEVVDYYLEIIHDKMDNGDSEKVAVASIGRIEDISRQALGDYLNKKSQNVKVTTDTVKSESSGKKVAYVLAMILISPLIFAFAIVMFVLGIVVPFVVGICSVAAGVAVVPNIIAGLTIQAPIWEIVHSSALLIVAACILGLFASLLRPAVKGTVKFAKSLWRRQK